MFVKAIAGVYWRGGSLHADSLPNSGPAVFIGNHLGTMGPIGTVCSIPLRFYPWIIADMVDKKLAPDYLRWDFIERTLKLMPPFSNALAWCLSRISVPLLSSLGSLAVDRNDYNQLQDALKATVALLKQGKVVMIFPEEPKSDLNPQTNMRPFMKGFTRLGELFYQETGKILHFYPIAVHESKNVMVGKPVPFNPANTPALERHRLKDMLEQLIEEMYLGLDEQVKVQTK